MRHAKNLLNLASTGTLAGLSGAHAGLAHADFHLSSAALITEAPWWGTVCPLGMCNRVKQGEGMREATRPRPARSHYKHSMHQLAHASLGVPVYIEATYK